MAFPGYFNYGGFEVINAERAATYAANAGARWFRDPLQLNTMHAILHHKRYRSPRQDGGAPWTDRDNPDTFRFWGVYPINVTGIEDSSRTSVITENIGDGGNAGLLRHGTKQLVFTVLLLGADDAALDAGMAWLRMALLGSSAGGCRGEVDCSGEVLSYFAGQPPYDPADDRDSVASTLPFTVSSCTVDYLRHMLRVVINSGPTVVQKNTLSDGSCAWTVNFAATASIPWEFGEPTPVVYRMFDRGLSAAVKFPAGGDHDGAGRKFHEVSCPNPAYHPVFDPDCPDLVLPPSVPSVRFGCFSPPTNWMRYSFEIPPELVPRWTEMVPIFTIETQAKKLQDMRIRIYPNGSGSFDPDANPCDFISDFWITYTPENSALVIDGRDSTILVLDTESRRADGLVFDSNHAPFTWPVLSCSIGYTVTIDVLQSQLLPFLSLDLAPRAR